MSRTLVVGAVMFLAGFMAAEAGSSLVDAASPCPPGGASTTATAAPQWGSQGSYYGVAPSSGPQNWHSSGIGAPGTTTLSAGAAMMTPPVPVTANPKFPALSCALTPDGQTINMSVRQVGIGTGSEIEYQFGSAMPALYVLQAPAAVSVTGRGPHGDSTKATVSIPAPAGATGGCIAVLLVYNKV